MSGKEVDWGQEEFNLRIGVNQGEDSLYNGLANASGRKDKNLPEYNFHTIDRNEPAGGSFQPGQGIRKSYYQHTSGGLLCVSDSRGFPIMVRGTTDMREATKTDLRRFIEVELSEIHLNPKPTTEVEVEVQQ